jgi:single-strand DNA-binding protein
MTMTRNHVNDEASREGTVRSPDRSTDVDGPTGPGRRTKSPVAHRNEIVVVGELTPPVEPRRRADGQEVLAFRVAVRSPVITAVSRDRDPSPTGSRDTAGPGRRDILDCVVSSTAVRRRLETYRSGDVVELVGSLRHRFWNTAGKVQSRYEVEVGTLKRLARAPASRTPEPERT